MPNPVGLKPRLSASSGFCSQLDANLEGHIRASNFPSVDSSNVDSCVCLVAPGAKARGVVSTGFWVPGEEIRTDNIIVKCRIMN